jgi:hypothetical protein
VWRAGGAIALAASRGEKVTIACLTFGERGESAKAWREGKKLDEIKAIRRDEAERAAATLGAEVRFFDAGDYPLVASAELTDRLVTVYRDTSGSPRCAARSGQPESTAGRNSWARTDRAFRPGARTDATRRSTAVSGVLHMYGRTICTDEPNWVIRRSRVLLRHMPVVMQGGSRDVGGR